VFLFRNYKAVAVVFWVLAVCALPYWVSNQGVPPGWDVRVYRNAVHSLRQARDPYADGIAVQYIYHLAAHAEGEMPPYTYVYSPLTLPLLKLVAAHPARFLAFCYWTLYATGFLLMIWASMKVAAPAEYPFIALFAPAAIFFPGLLFNTVVLSGNVAYPLYGAAWAAALLGWRRDRWLPFYCVTFAAACCKGPLLTLLAIPFFSSRRQWLPAGLVASAGLTLFLLQPVLWPSEFHNYLQAVSLQFSYNRDFGVSPAGLLGHALAVFARPYSVPGAVFYLFYAGLVGSALLHLSRRFRAGEISLQQWMPIVMVGTILLNPRIKEYDIAAITLPMAVLAWRLCGLHSTDREQAWKALTLMLSINWIANSGGETGWLVTECLLLTVLLAGGAWQLRQEPTRQPQPALAPALSAAHNIL